jgi:hypothetical protein
VGHIRVSSGITLFFLINLKTRVVFFSSNLEVKATGKRVEHRKVLQSERLWSYWQVLNSPKGISLLQATFSGRVYCLWVKLLGWSTIRRKLWL